MIDMPFVPLVEQIARRCAADPDGVALEAGGLAMTAGQLAGWAGQIADDLRADGLVPGDRVVIGAARTPGLIASMVGVLAAGGVAVPIDRSLPAARRALMAESSGATRLLCVGDDGLDGVLPGMGIPPFPDREHDTRLIVTHRERRDPAYIFFTSGSTGTPKGVLGTQVGLSSFIDWMAGEFVITSVDRISLLRSSSFDASLREIFVPLLTGATLVLGPEPMNPDEAVDWLRRRRITVVNATPSHVAVWLDALEEPLSSSLRWVFFSGERLEARLVERWRRLLTNPGSIVNLYGPTETTMVRTCYVVPPECDPDPLPVGFALPHSDLHVLDPDGNPCPAGEKGEVVIATDVGTLGYLDEREADRFIVDPGGVRAGAYRTGDIGWMLEDGNLVVSGRIDDQVQILGVRTEPAEVAATIATHPDVERAVVLAEEDARGDTHLAAFLILADGAEFDEVALRTFLFDRVMGPAMPHRFVVLDGFPLNANGKVDRRALLEQRSSAAPVRDVAQAAPPAGRPERHRDLEERVRALDPDQRAALERRLRQRAGREDLIERVKALDPERRRELAERVRSRAAEQASGPERTAPLSFAQERLWFLEQLFPGRGNYNIPRVYRMRGSLDPDALRSACDTIQARHEALRTRFAEEDGEAVQVVDPPGPAPLEFVDLSGHDVEDDPVQTLIAEECGRLFDLHTGPLWKVTVVRLSEIDHVMVFVTHHIASDGWSLPPLTRELIAGYTATLEGTPVDLPDLPIQYADYAIRQRARHAEGGFEASLAYWEAELDGAPALLTLPGSQSRPALPSHRGARVRFSFPQVPAEWLERAVRHHSATPFMVTLALYQGYLSRISGARDLVVGVPSADRTEGDLQDLIGFFVNSLAIRVRITDGMSFRDLLEQVRASAIRSYDHREVPFEHVVRRLAPPRATDRTPLFQVFFQFGAGDFTTPLELPGIEATRIIQPTERSKFDITTYLGIQDGCLAGSAVYSTELFGEADMERFVDGFGAFCAAALADPDRLLDEMPLDATGAVELPVRGPLADAPVRPEVVTSGFEDDARAIADIWEDLLGVEVGPDDDFFELGGHSLMAIRVFSRIEAALGRPLPIGAIFEAPTPRGLAARLAETLEEGAIARAPESVEPEVQTAPAGDSAPLSFAQQRLWFLERLTPGSAGYHIAWRLRLRGPLDLDALQVAMDAVVARHGALRTRIVEVDGSARQVVDLPNRIEIRREDLRQVAADGRDAALIGLLQKELRRPFALEEGPLLRAIAIRIADDEHVLSIVVHHIVSDAESRRIFLRELEEAYRAARAGAPAALPPLNDSFVEFAERQRRRFAVESVLELDAWAERIGDAPRILEVAADRTRGPAATAMERMARDAAPIAQRLRQVAARCNATPFMVALAACGVLLSRHSGEDEFLVGLPSTERRSRGTEELIGYFVNTLPVRIDLSGSPSFETLVERVRGEVLFALEHADVPLERIIQRLDVPRDPTRNPLFQVVFDLSEPGRRSAGFAGLDVLPVGVAAGEKEARFDLRFFCTLGKNRLGISTGYRTDLLDDGTARAISRQFLAILDGLLDDPERSVDTIPVLPAEDRSLAEADASCAPPHRIGLVERLEEIVRRHADRPAVVDRGTSHTYAELWAASERIADRLRRLGVGPGFTVGVSMDRSAAIVAAVVAIARTGAAYVPLDPAYPTERLATIESDSAVAALISARDAGPFDVKVELGRSARPVLDPDAGAVYVMYTSGSTGKPKGVVVPDRAITRLVLETDYVSLAPGDVVAFASNTAFDAATFEVWGALLNGATLHVIDRDTLLAPARLAAELRDGEIDTMFMTTALFNAVVARRPDAFATLRDLLFGGEAADLTAVRRCLAGGPPTRLLNVYGPTETTTFATAHLVESVAPDARSIPIGRPISRTSARVVDRHGNDVGVGMPGQLVIGGPGVALGYLGDPELTASRFRPRQDGQIEYWTGDLARRRSDGAIEYLGRIDRQLKLRGYRIEPGEIEMQMSAHPSVHEAAVVVQPADPVDRLVGFVVPNGPAPSSRDLHDHLVRTLPPYMIPVAFEVLGELPRTPNGKLDVAALPQVVTETEPFVAPAGAAMERMAALWERVLEVERVGANDDFFALGGHSLVAIKLFTEIEREFGRAEPLSTLFEAPTLAALTERVAVVEEPPHVDVADHVVEIRSGGPAAPVFCLPPAGGNVMVYEPMARAFGGERTVYGVQAPGVDGVTEPLATIEELAEHCERQIVATHPAGPYLLVGYSMGGLVAWEVARRLRRAGRQVDLVALVDAQLGRRLAPIERVMTDARIIKRYRTDGARLVAKRVGRTLRSAAGKVRHGPGAALAKVRGQALDPLQAGRRLTAAGMEATLRYEPQPYDGPVVYLRAEVLSGPWERAGVGRWRQVANGGLEVVELPGSHKGTGSIMHDPNAAVLAKELRAIIERGQQQ